MSQLKIVSYTQDYLEEVLECWNETLCYDVISKERFLDFVLLDDNFDARLLKLALVDNRCVGFVYGVRRCVPYLERGLEPTRGWIVAMGVLEDYQRQNIGAKLLDSLEVDFKQLGIQNITIGAYSPNYFFPGIDLRYEKAVRFFEKNNYPLGGLAVSMQRDLLDYMLPLTTREKLESLHSEGIRIIPYETKYLEKTLDFLLSEFGAGWKRNAFMAMQKGEAEKTILLCVNKQDEIIGFCMRKIDGLDCRFGPIGVKETLRSKGLGGVLLDVMMLEMKKKGLYYLYFLWTSGDAIRFYERHGFRTYRTYHLSRKEI